MGIPSTKMESEIQEHPNASASDKKLPEQTNKMPKLIILVIICVFLLGTYILAKKANSVNSINDNTNVEQNTLNNKHAPTNNEQPQQPREKVKNENLIVKEDYYFTYPTELETTESLDIVEISNGKNFKFTTEVIKNKELEELVTNYEKQFNPDPKYITDAYGYYERIDDRLYYHLFTNIGKNTWIKRSYNSDIDVESEVIYNLLLNFTPKVETTTWQTYIDNDKYSIKYPNTWELSIGTEYVDDAIVLRTKSDKPSDTSRDVELIIGDYEILDKFSAH